MIGSDKRNRMTDKYLKTKLNIEWIQLRSILKVDNRSIADCRFKSYLLVIWNQNIWTSTDNNNNNSNNNNNNQKHIYELNVLCDSRG